MLSVGLHLAAAEGETLALEGVIVGHEALIVESMVRRTQAITAGPHGATVGLTAYGALLAGNSSEELLARDLLLDMIAAAPPLDGSEAAHEPGTAAALGTVEASAARFVEDGDAPSCVALLRRSSSGLRRTSQRSGASTYDERVGGARRDEELSASKLQSKLRDQKIYLTQEVWARCAPTPSPSKTAPSTHPVALLAQTARSSPAAIALRPSAATPVPARSDRSADRLERAAGGRF